MNTEMRYMREDEHGALLSLIDTAFGFEQGNFLSILPKLYRMEYAPWESNLCVFEDGIPAAAVGAYYDTVAVGGEELSVCGIGNVGVHPDFRGRGYMIDIMTALCDEMEKRGADISLLGGDRFRYGHFGFDPGSLNCIFEIGRHSLAKQLGYSAADVSTVTDESDPRLSAMEKLYRNGDFAYSRRRAQFFHSLLSWKAQVFCAADGSAYCTLVNSKQIGELRMKDPTPKKLGEFLLGVMDLSGADNVILTIGINDKPLRTSAAAIADESSVKDSERMLVLNWEKLIRACLTAESKKVRFDDVSCVIRIRGARRVETLAIEVKGGEVSVNATDSEPNYDFSRVEAADVMLKSASPQREELPANVRSLFPLKFAISQADMV